MSATVEGEYLHQTDDAILLEIEGDEYWIPKSLIENLSMVDGVVQGEEVAIELPTWFAEKEGVLHV